MAHEFGPYDGRYGTASVIETTLVQATVQTPSERLELTRVDTPALMLELTYSALLIYPDVIDFGRLKTAVQEWAQLHKSFAGRINSEGPQVYADCNNAGIPLTLVHWPEGRTTDFPQAVGYRCWECTTPAHPAPPIFTDDIYGLPVAFEGESPLKLRLTTLGDGGCVLAATVWHGLLDGIRLITVLSDLARLYRGESPPARSATRVLLTPAGLAKFLPNGEKIVQEVTAAHKGADEDREPNIREAYQRIFGKVDVMSPVYKTPPEIPAGPRAMSNATLHLTRKDLENLKGALLEALENGKPAPKLSDNDIVLAIAWCLRRLDSGLPLPGLEEESAKDLGIMTVDLGYNAIPNSLLDNFVGNAYVCMPLTLLPLEKPPAVTSGAAKAGSAEHWMHAVGYVATSARAAIEDFRAGTGLQGLLHDLIIPNKLQTDFDRTVGIQYTSDPEAFKFRSLVTSWERFKTEEVDFGSGPPQLVLPYFHTLIEKVAIVTNAPGHDGVYMHLVMPAKGVSHITGLQRIMPNSKFLEGATPLTSCTPKLH